MLSGLIAEGPKFHLTQHLDVLCFAAGNVLARNCGPHTHLKLNRMTVTEWFRSRFGCSTCMHSLRMIALRVGRSAGNLALLPELIHIVTSTRRTVAVLRPFAEPRF